MEVAEKFAYRTQQFIPFGLERAVERELYCVTAQTKAFILQLIYSHHCDERIFMEQSTLSDISKFMPSRGVPRNSANIFNRATKQQQDRLLVDYHLMTEELKVESERVALVQTRWSPSITQSNQSEQFPGHCYLAYLTNFGGCEIRRKHSGKLSWCIVVDNLAKDWMLYCQKTSMKYAFNTFETFENAVYSIKIIAITWNHYFNDKQSNSVNHSKTLDFCFATANGNIVFYKLHGAGSAGDEAFELQFHKNVKLKQINSIEWSTFQHKKLTRSYAIACEIKGTINLFSVRLNCNENNSIVIEDVIEMTKLFDESDGVCANGIQWEYCKQNNQLIFVICKGQHVFAYLYNLDNESVQSSCIHYVGHLTIHGITKREPLEYVVGTFNGYLECLRIKVNANIISIESEVMKQPNGHTKYALYGVATSINNAFLLGAYFAGRPYDHLQLREPGHIAVCHQLGGSKSLELLLNNPNHSLTYKQDLAEAIRNIQLRNDTIFKNYLDIYPTEIVCSKEYVYALKVRLILTSARSTYLRQKNRMIESGTLLGEYNVLKKFILAIQSYSILTHLNQHPKKLNEFQIISSQCHRTSLYEFNNLSIFDEYEAIKAKFHIDIEKLLTQTDSLDKRAVEKCVYCDLPVDRIKGICEQGHDLPRCCISMTQIPIMNQRQCIQCQSFALDDVEKLNEILPSFKSDDLTDDAAPICPLCDVPMEKPHLTFFDNLD